MYLSVIAGMNSDVINLHNQSCITRSAIINSSPNEYNQGLGYFPFIIDLDRSK